MRLAGKVAIVTGGGAGIGRACVELFAKEGARVVIAELGEPNGAATQEAVTASRGTCVFVPTDVSDPDNVKRAVDTAVERYGRLDIIYNNTGGSTLQDGPVTKALPAIGETVQGFSVVFRFGLSGPPAMAPQLTQRINEEVSKVLRSPETVARFAEFAIEAGHGSPSEFAAMVASDIARWTRVVTANKINSA